MDERLAQWRKTKKVTTWVGGIRNYCNKGCVCVEGIKNGMYIRYSSNLIFKCELIDESREGDD